MGKIVTLKLNCIKHTHTVTDGFSLVMSKSDGETLVRNEVARTAFLRNTSQNRL